MIISYSAFKTEVKALAFPDREAENMVAVHDVRISKALILAQTYVPCLRGNKVNYYPDNDRITTCGMDIVDSPADGASDARIGAVYAFVPGVDCKRLFYRQVSTADIQCILNANAACSDQNDEVYYESAYCDTLTETEDDSVFANCADRIWAVGGDGRVYIYPRLPCAYTLAIHWEGIKRIFTASDFIDSHDDLKDAVSLYLESQNALRDDGDGAFVALEGKWREAVSDLEHLCRKSREVRESGVCDAFVDPEAFFPYFINQEGVGFWSVGGNFHVS